MQNTIKQCTCLKTKIERDKYIKPATEFVRTRCCEKYAGVSEIAITAIAEYLAYQDGFSIRNSNE